MFSLSWTLTYCSSVLVTHRGAQNTFYADSFISLGSRLECCCVRFFLGNVIIFYGQSILLVSCYVYFCDVWGLPFDTMRANLLNMRLHTPTTPSPFTDSAYSPSLVFVLITFFILIFKSPMPFIIIVVKSI